MEWCGQFQELKQFHMATGWVGTGLQWKMGLENKQSDGATLSLIEGMGNQQRVLFEEHGSALQIHKKIENFLLKEIIKE